MLNLLKENLMKVLSKAIQKNMSQQQQELLRVDEEIVNNSLITRTIHIMGSQGGDTICAQTPEASEFARDALCKFIYSKMFDWLVTRLNESMGGEKHPLYIGILDIFGFEIFQHNSFEQLCMLILQMKCCNNI